MVWLCNQLIYQIVSDFYRVCKTEYLQALDSALIKLGRHHKLEMHTRASEKDLILKTGTELSTLRGSVST